MCSDVRFRADTAYLCVRGVFLWLDASSWTSLMFLSVRVQDDHQLVYRLQWHAVASVTLKQETENSPSKIFAL